MERTRGYLIELAVVAAVGVVLAALGPFGSFAMGDFGARLAYWLPGAFVGYAGFRPIFVAAEFAARRLAFPATAGAIAGVLFGALPASALVLWWNGGRLEELSGPSHAFQLYIQVATIGAIVALFFTLLERSAGTFAAAEQAAEPKPTPDIPFLRRLPPDIAADLIALEMEDHYLRAHSPGRSTLILMRMRDAEAELNDVDGHRVHRSWWVARGAVEHVIRDGRKVALRLRGGLTAPVARDRLPALRSAGWIE